MATKVVVGNLLEDATITMTPAADPLFPAEFLHDGPGQLGARFGALDADPEIVVDLGAVSHGDGLGTATAGQAIAVSENDIPIPPDVETDWSIALGSAPGHGNFAQLMVAADATFSDAPDHTPNGLSLYLVGAGISGEATAKLPIRKRAGTACRVTAWAMKVTADTGVVAVRLYSRRTGKYLTSAGAWTGSVTNLLSAGTFDYLTTWFGPSGGFLDFVTESAEELGSEFADLELQLYTSLIESTPGRFDDLSVVEAADLMMVANGHNIPSALAPVWESSVDGITWTPRATFIVGRHQFFALLDAPISDRFHRLKMTGTPISKVYLSDLVLGLAEALEREPVTSTPIVKSYRELGQQRLETPAGSRRIANRGPYAPRTFELSFRFPTAAEEAAVMALLVDKVRGGAESVVVIPADDLGPAAAVYGDLGAGAQVSHNPALAFQPDDTKREYYSDVRFTVDEGAGFVLEDDA